MKSFIPITMNFLALLLTAFLCLTQMGCTEQPKTEFQTRFEFPPGWRLDFDGLPSAIHESEPDWEMEIPYLDKIEVWAEKKGDDSEAERLALQYKHESVTYYEKMLGGQKLYVIEELLNDPYQPYWASMIFFAKDGWVYTGIIYNGTLQEKEKEIQMLVETIHREEVIVQ